METAAHDRSALPEATRRPAGVVLMVPGFPADEDDTDCLPAVQNYVAALAATRPDLDVHVIAFQYPYARGEYRWKGTTVHALAGANRTGWRRLPTWVRAARAFARLRRQLDVRVLHTFWLEECTAVGRWLAGRSGVRHVASIGGQDARAANPWLRRLELRDTVVTAGSRFAAEVFAEAADGPEARVIPLGLDTAHLGAIDAPPERDNDLISVGSLIPLKNHSLFLEVAAALRQEFPAVRAQIVGSGPEHDTLVRRIAQLDLADNVTLCGALPRDEVFRRMLRSRILLHTSAYESQGYVFLEALFAGLDVVCFDVGHTGDTPRAHRCESTDELIDACRRLLRDPPAPIPQPVPTVEDTVRAFEALYEVQ